MGGSVDGLSPERGVSEKDTDRDRECDGRRRRAKAVEAQAVA